MTPRGGPAARNAIDPAVLVAFIDSVSEYKVRGFPKRERLLVNFIAILDNDARMIRRWRSGKIKGVTVPSAEALLKRYALTLPMLGIYAKLNDTNPMLRGKLPVANSTKENS